MSTKECITKSLHHEKKTNTRSPIYHAKIEEDSVEVSTTQSSQ